MSKRGFLLIALTTPPASATLLEPIARMAGVPLERASRKLPTHGACTREEKPSEELDIVVYIARIGTFSGAERQTRNQRLTGGERRGTVA